MHYWLVWFQKLALHFPPSHLYKKKMMLLLILVSESSVFQSDTTKCNTNLFL